MKLAVCVAYFNNVKEIPRLLDPVYKHVDMVIAIDGKYPGFEWDGNLSTDGSTELLIEKYNAVVEINKSPVEQIDKRNQYLDIAESAGMDWVLVLDTDDYLHKKWQDWNRFYSELDKLKDDKLANIYSWISPKWRKNWNLVEDNTWKLYTRLIRPDKVRYDVTHWTFSAKRDPTIFEMPRETVDGIRITSDSTLRTKKYMDAGFEWAKKQMVEEDIRFEEPRVKRMKYNYWIKEIKRVINMPNTIILRDNTPDKITEKIKKEIENP